MTKDYKQASSGGGRASLLPGIAIGIVIGLAAAIAVVLFVRKTPDSFVDRTQQPAETDTRAVIPQPAPPAVSTQSAPDGEKPRFDFYNILPGEEPAAPKAPAQPTGDSAPPVKPEQYFLQLGSFQSETEADNLKAKVALMGVEARIETTNVPDKGLFHRVRVGPYATLAEVTRVRDQLNQNGLSSSLVKVDQTN